MTSCGNEFCSEAAGGGAREAPPHVRARVCSGPLLFYDLTKSVFSQTCVSRGPGREGGGASFAIFAMGVPSLRPALGR